MERLLKVRKPWPVRTNPVYAIDRIQKIARAFMGLHTSEKFQHSRQTRVPRERCLKGRQAAAARALALAGWRRSPFRRYCTVFSF
jgi:hypothetical protein